MSPARRRQAVAMLRDRLQALRAALRQIAADRRRWGYRRAHYELCQQGWSVNRKRVQRLACRPTRPRGFRSGVQRILRTPLPNREDAR